jgi:hypothetical protein
MDVDHKIATKNLHFTYICCIFNFFRCINIPDSVRWIRVSSFSTGLQGTGNTKALITRIIWYCKYPLPKLHQKEAHEGNSFFSGMMFNLTKPGVGYGGLENAKENCVHMIKFFTKHPEL